MNSPKATARGDYICVKGFWEEILRIAELNVIAAQEIGAQDPSLAEWHQERIKAMISRVTLARTTCAVRLKTGEWHFHL